MIFAGPTRLPKLLADKLQKGSSTPGAIALAVAVAPSCCLRSICRALTRAGSTDTPNFSAGFTIASLTPASLKYSGGISISNCHDLPCEDPSPAKNSSRSERMTWTSTLAFNIAASSFRSGSGRPARWTRNRSN